MFVSAKETIYVGCVSRYAYWCRICLREFRQMTATTAADRMTKVVMGMTLQGKARVRAAHTRRRSHVRLLHARRANASKTVRGAPSRYCTTHSDAVSYGAAGMALVSSLSDRNENHYMHHHYLYTHVLLLESGGASGHTWNTEREPDQVSK